MIAYHFTAIEYLESILQEGIIRGELPVSASVVQNVVNLTTDGNPLGHGLTDGRSLTERDIAALRSTGTFVPDGAYFPNKRAVRITVRVPESSLKRWLPWANRHLDPGWRSGMIETGGGLAKAKSWWFSRKPIPPSQFVRIELADGAGGWSEYAPESAGVTCLSEVDAA